MLHSDYSESSGLNKPPKLKDEQLLRRNSHGHEKLSDNIQMKKLAAQVHFNLYLGVHSSTDGFSPSVAVRHWIQFDVSDDVSAGASIVKVIPGRAVCRS